MATSKAELRRLVAQGTRERRQQTHSVFIGKFRYPGYLDGDVIRAIQDDEVLAKKTRRGWTAKVIYAEPLKGRYDAITADGPAVTVHLDKGVCY